MNIEHWSLAQIKPYQNNPRHNDGAVEAVAQSIQEVGRGRVGQAPRS